MRIGTFVHRWVFLSAILPVAGCASIQDSHYEHSQRLKTDCAYINYWWCNKECMGTDYRRGWKAGYLDVMTGGNGQPPLVAPHCYWNGDDCDVRRQDWYSGWQDGAFLATLKPNSHYVKLWDAPVCATAMVCEPGCPVQTSCPPGGPAMAPPSDAQPLPEEWSAIEGLPPSP